MVSDFLDWTAGAQDDRLGSTCPSKKRQGGPRTDDETRWAGARRLLHDDALDLADRVAGSRCSSTASSSPASPPSGATR